MPVTLIDPTSQGNRKDFNDIPPATRQFYIHTLKLLQQAGMSFMVGGGHALAHYTGVNRSTHDLDIFVRPEDAQATLNILAEGGYQTEMTFPHWLGKAHSGSDHVDIIFNSGNGVCPVDEEWFRHAPATDLCGIEVKLAPVEETLWQKCLIEERERYDGADVAHLLLTNADTLDWNRLLARFASNWRVLLSHLIMFGFIYPSERNQIPAVVLKTLLDQLHAEMAADTPDNKICYGTLLSREQYLVDVTSWGYADGRRAAGYMKAEEIQRWTDAIESKT